MLSFRPTRGFTLIELVIAIALVGLLLLVGLPAFKTMISNLRVRSVSDSVLSGLQVARTEALKRNQNVTFRLDAATGGGWSVILADNSVFQSKSAAEGNAVNVALNPNGTQVIFSNLGRRILPVPGTVDVLDINITNPSVGTCEEVGGSVRCLRVTVAIGGEARLCDPKRVIGDPQAC